MALSRPYTIEIKKQGLAHTGIADERANVLEILALIL
jgi:hypothetical protein